MASEALSSLAIPPAASSINTLWRRHTTRVRWFPMSMLRFANSRRISAWSAARTSRNAGARSAAIATDNASLGSVLSERPVAEHPHPRHQRRGHVEHGLAGIDELLGQEIAEPAGGLDRPRAFPERLRPRQQLRRLLARRTHPRAVEFALAVVDRDRGVTRLVGIDTDDHRHEHLPGLDG